MYGESFSVYKTLSMVWLLYFEVKTALSITNILLEVKISQKNYK